MQSDHYLTQSEAAEVLRISPRTLERMRVDGSGPRYRKAGRRVLYSRADLDAWLNSQVFVSTSKYVV